MYKMKLLRLSVLAILLFISCKNEKKEIAPIEVNKPMNILFIAVDDLRPELIFMAQIISNLQI